MHRFSRVLDIAASVACFLVMMIAVESYAEDDKAQEEAIFYPAPPEMPRLQFLKKFSSALDVETKSKGFRK